MHSFHLASFGVTNREFRAFLAEGYEDLVGFEETRRRYRPNRFGVYHASGNAREWTQSVFRPYGEEHPYRDDGRNDDDAPGMRVTRGGSWYSASAVRLLLAYREEFQPELSSDDLGFRIAAVLGAAIGRE